MKIHHLRFSLQAIRDFCALPIFHLQIYYRRGDGFLFYFLYLPTSFSFFFFLIYTPCKTLLPRNVEGPIWLTSNYLFIYILHVRFLVQHDEYDGSKCVKHKENFFD